MPELTYQHGVRIEPVPDGNISLTVVDQATVGIIGTAPAADNAKFPLNTPIGITGDPDQLTALGATGTLRDQINNMIAAAGGTYIPKTAIVRVTEGADAEATIANMVGSAGSMTGWHAFKGARSELGFKPKIYMAPGFSGQRIDDAANPLITAMVPWLERQRARMVVAGPGTTKEAAIEYRDDFGSMVLDIVDPRVIAPDPDTGINAVQPPEAFVIGLGIRIIRAGDAESKKPAGFWVSWSNAEVGAMVNTERRISFDMLDPDTESHLLNENRINTFVRDKGWRYWGGLSASSDDNWMFSNVVRTRFAIEEMLAEGFKPIIDAPMTAPAVVEAISSLDDKLLDFKEAGAILGGRAFFLPGQNSNGQLRAGKLRVEFDAEETPPIHALSIGSRRNIKYFDVLVDDIVREIAAA